MSDNYVAEDSQYLTFLLRGEQYAIRILSVKEIIAYDAVTRVPNTPPWIRGVINLRGSVVPVVDLSTKFSLGESPITKSTCIVIVEVNLEGEQATMGVLADAVDEVIQLSPENIERPPAFGSRVSVDFLLGIGKLGGKFVLILDIHRVLSSNELLQAVSAVELTEEAAPSVADAVLAAASGSAGS